MSDLGGQLVSLSTGSEIITWASYELRIYSYKSDLLIISLESFDLLVYWNVGPPTTGVYG